MKLLLTAIAFFMAGYITSDFMLDFKKQKLDRAIKGAEANEQAFRKWYDKIESELQEYRARDYFESVPQVRTDLRLYDCGYVNLLDTKVEINNNPYRYPATSIDVNGENPYCREPKLGLDECLIQKTGKL